MEVTNICDYLGFLLLSYCVTQSDITQKQERTTSNSEVIYQWNFINLTWPTSGEYENAVLSGAYIQGNSTYTDNCKIL